MFRYVWSQDIRDVTYSCRRLIIEFLFSCKIKNECIHFFIGVIYCENWLYPLVHTFILSTFVVNTENWFSFYLLLNAKGYPHLKRSSLILNSAELILVIVQKLIGSRMSSYYSLVFIFFSIYLGLIIILWTDTTLALRK